MVNINVTITVIVDLPMKSMVIFHSFLYVHPYDGYIPIDQWEISRILKWRYVSTMFQAIFCWDIPLHRPKR